MDLIFICIVAFVISCFLFLWPIGLLINRTSWAIKTKKIIFSFGGAAIVFPVLFPVDLVGIPTPNIFFVFRGIDVLDIDVEVQIANGLPAFNVMGHFK